MRQMLQLLFPKVLLPPPPPKKNGWLIAASIKYLNLPIPVFGRFQNGCNKVVIRPRYIGNHMISSAED